MYNRAIVLDPANPSVKSQAKSMAAAAVEGEYFKICFYNLRFINFFT